MNPAIVTAGAGTALATISGVSLLNEMIQQYVIGSGQTISIHLTNRCKGKILSNPQVYMYPDWGDCFNPPQPTVLPGPTDICSFAGSSSGTAGVLTYDLGNQRLAIMFTAYYNNPSKYRFDVGFFGLNETAEELYKYMYYTKPNYIKTDGTETHREGKGCSVKVTMTQMNKSVMKVEVWDE